MPDDAYRGQAVADFEGELVEVQVWVEEVAFVFSACFESEVLAILLC